MTISTAVGTKLHLKIVSRMSRISCSLGNIFIDPVTALILSTYIPKAWYPNICCLDFKNHDIFEVLHKLCILILKKSTVASSKRLEWRSCNDMEEKRHRKTYEHMTRYSSVISKIWIFDCSVPAPRTGPIENSNLGAGTKLFWNDKNS